ncbi:Mitochondrial copper homeostasis protein [Epichloe bromicola]
MSSSSQQEPGKDPWDSEAKEKFETKSKSKFYDPCQEAAQRSYRCLYRNRGDKAMCGEYFQYTERRKKEKGGFFG